MKTQRLWLPIVLASVTGSVAGCHSPAADAPTPAAALPPPPASVQQNGVQMQEYRISHSNLSPDQKQRALQQLGASGGR